MSVRAIRSALTLLLVLAALSGPRDAQACSCITPPAPAEALLAADAVFVGVPRGMEVVDFIPPAGPQFRQSMRLYRFEVLGAWKGVSSAEVLVRTGSGGGDCGYDFMRGEVYVVYAHRRAAGDTLGTSICSRTRSLDRANEDLAQLARPAYVHVEPADWAARRPPGRCPVHPAFPIRVHHERLLVAEEALWDARAFVAAQADFPYAALDVVSVPDPFAFRYSGSIEKGLVCVACREAAIEWSHQHGAVCRKREPAPADATPHAHEGPDAYRLRRPFGNFAFLFDDGRRLRLDTIEGRLDRSYGTVPDTMIALALDDSTLRSLYELAIEHRLFDRAAPHPPYARADAAGGPTCVRAELFVRSDTLVREYRWEPALAPRAPGPKDPWAGFRVFAEAVGRAIEAHPAYRALPALPVR